MAKSDAGTKATDDAVAELEKRIKTVYRRAYNEIRQTIIDFNNDYAVKSQEKQQQLQDGKITQEQYNAWEAGQKFQGKMWEEKKAHLLSVVNSANQKAVELVNNQKKDVFITNANYQGYQLEKDVGASISFSLYDSNTVARLIKDDPKLLPDKKVSSSKDKAWNSKKVNAAIQQGILQGQSIPQIAKNLSSSLSSTNQKAMIRTARTAMTSAENAGRLEGMKQAEEQGVQMKKQWLAAKDSRVRDTHARLDGQIVDVDKPFVIDGKEIMYPGDPSAPPEEVYNCRCTLKYIYPQFSKPGAKDYYLDEDGNKQPVTETTFAEWVKLKEQESAQVSLESIKDQIDSMAHYEDPDSPYFSEDYYKVNPIATADEDAIKKVNSIYNNMTDADDAKFQETTLDIDSLKSEQGFINAETLKSLVDSYGTDEVSGIATDDNTGIRVIKYNGEYIVIDGNHRANLALLKGQTQIDVMVYDYDAEQAQKQAEEAAKKAAEEAAKKAEEEAKKKAEEEAKKKEEEEHHQEIVDKYKTESLYDALITINGYDPDAAQEFWKEIDAIGQSHGIDAGQAWEEYKNGKLFSHEEMKTLDSHFDKFEETKKKVEEEAKKAAEEAAKKAEEEAKKKAEEAAKKAEEAKKKAEEEAKKKAEEEVKKKQEKGLTHNDVVAEHLTVDDGTGNKEQMTYTDATYMLGVIGDDAPKLEDILGQYSESHGGLNTVIGKEGAFNAYLNGTMDAETTKKIDELILKNLDPDAKLAEPKEEEVFTHDDLVAKFEKKGYGYMGMWLDIEHSKGTDAADEFEELFNKLEKDNGFIGKSGVWKMYKAGSLDAESTKKIDEKLAGYYDLKLKKEEELIGGFSKDVIQKKIELETPWLVSSQLYSNGTPQDTVIAWQQLQKEYWKSTHYAETIIDGYMNGSLDADTAKKVEEFIAMTIPNTGDPEKHVDALKAVKGHKVTEFKKEIASVNNKLSTDFGKELKAIGDDMGIAAKDVFEKYQEGTLNADGTAKLDTIVGSYLEKKAAGETHTVKSKAKTSAATSATGTGGLSPATEAAKQAAVSFDDRYVADKYHRPYADKVYEKLTPEEQYGIFEYTRNSNPINKPLSGYHDTWNRRGFIGVENTVWGREDAWRGILDTPPGTPPVSSEMKKFGKPDGRVDYHKAITCATKAIEKSSLPEDCWLVRGSSTGGLAGLFEGDLLSFDTAQQLLDSGSRSSFNKLRSMVMNQTFTNHAFTSTGIAEDSGFGGQVKYSIFAPKGTKGIYAEPQSQYGDTSPGKLYRKGKAYSSVSKEAEIILQRGTTFRVSDFRMNAFGNYEIELEVVEQPSYFTYGDEDTYNNGRTRHKK